MPGNTDVDKTGAAYDIIDIWTKEGEDEYFAGVQGMPAGIPLHPEFVYRKNGMWKGWNDLLGANEESNNERDSLENVAWSVYIYENP